MNAAKAQNTDRRGFLSTAATIAGVSLLGATASSTQAAELDDNADKAVKMLYEALTDAQRRKWRRFQQRSCGQSCGHPRGRSLGASVPPTVSHFSRSQKHNGLHKFDEPINQFFGFARCSLIHFNTALQLSRLSGIFPELRMGL